MHRAPSWHPFVPGGGTLAQCTQCASVPPSTVTIRLGLVHVYINKMYRSSVVWTKVTCSSGVSSAAMCVGVTSACGMCSSHVLVTCAGCMWLLHVLVAYQRGDMRSAHLIKQVSPPCVRISKSPCLTIRKVFCLFITTVLHPQQCGRRSAGAGGELQVLHALTLAALALPLSRARGHALCLSCSFFLFRSRSVSRPARAPSQLTGSMGECVGVSR